MEFLDIVDINGNPTGEIVERNIAHSNGIMHRTSHVWLFRKRNDSVEVLLQKRSSSKDSFPNCYDISSAGHIPAGIDFIPSAIRELKEELGIDVNENELIYCGDRIITRDEVFHGKPFRDNQFSRVFALWYDLDENSFDYQVEELSGVCWMNFDELFNAVQENTIQHCIYLEELLLLKNKLNF